MVPLTEFYAIRHKATGFFLPAPTPGRYPRPFTHVSPAPLCVPKLYPTKNGAEQGLAIWLKGPLYRAVTPADIRSGRKWITRPEEYYGIERKAEDMEVVPVGLHPHF